MNPATNDSEKSSPSESLRIHSELGLRILQQFRDRLIEHPKLQTAEFFIQSERTAGLSWERHNLYMKSFGHKLGRLAMATATINDCLIQNSADSYLNLADPESIDNFFSYILADALWKSRRRIDEVRELLG